VLVVRLVGLLVSSSAWRLEGIEGLRARAARRLGRSCLAADKPPLRVGFESVRKSWQFAFSELELELSNLGAKQWICFSLSV